MDDARLWMPETASYRVVHGPGATAAQRTSTSLRHFLLALFLPRRQTEHETARWVFCYDCAPSVLGPQYEILSDSRAKVPVCEEEAVTLRAIGGLVVLNAFILGVGAGVLWGLRGWRWWTDARAPRGCRLPPRLERADDRDDLRARPGDPDRCRDRVAERRRDRGTRRAPRAPTRVHGADAASARMALAAALAPGSGVRRGHSSSTSKVSSGRVASQVSLGEWDSWANWIPKAQEIFRSGRLEPEFLRLVQDLQLPSYPPGPRDDPSRRLSRHGYRGHGDVARAVLVLRRGVRRSRDRSPCQPCPPRDPVPGAAGVPRGAEPRGLEHDALRGHPARLSRGRRGTARPAVDRGEGAVAACSGDGAPVRCDAHQARGPTLRGLRPAFAGSSRPSWSDAGSGHGSSLPDSRPSRSSSRGASGSWPTTSRETRPAVAAASAVVSSDRFWPSVEFGVETLFDQALWRFVPFVAAAAVLLALLAGAWRASLYAAVFFVTAVASAAWVFWVNPGLGLTSDEWTARRFTGTTVLALAVLTPLLLQRAWSSQPAELPRASPQGRTRSCGDPVSPGWSCSCGVLSHPGAMLVGYSGSGAARWPAELSRFVRLCRRPGARRRRPGRDRIRRLVPRRRGDALAGRRGRAPGCRGGPRRVRTTACLRRRRRGGRGITTAGRTGRVGRARANRRDGPGRLRVLAR